MIVIPDIHGQSFWEKAAKNRGREKIIFLGDYLDPYPNDWKSGEEIWKKTWENFLEIIEFKKKHPKNVILLLGNHDLHYLYDTGNGDRYDFFHARMIRKAFEENKALFQLAYEEKIGGRRFIFTHAGIHRLWIEDWFGPVVTDKNVVDYFNNAYMVDSENLPRALDQFSTYRGGYESYGSMVWADVMEWRGAKESDYGDVQVFGHTRVKIPFNINDTFYCLDVGRGFLIDKEGVVRELDGKPINKISEKEKTL